MWALSKHCEGEQIVPALEPPWVFDRDFPVDDQPMNCTSFNIGATPKGYLTLLGGSALPDKPICVGSPRSSGPPMDSTPRGAQETQGLPSKWGDLGGRSTPSNVRSQTQWVPMGWPEIPENPLGPHKYF